GPETVRYGGNTSCVEVRAEDGTLLVLDAGTGIRALGERVNGSVSRIDLLLTHMHMDHIQGLGFFKPLYEPGMDVHIWGPPSLSYDLRARLARYLSPPLFPVSLRDLPSKPTLHNIVRSQFSIGPFEIESDLVCHPGPTLAYRIREGSRVLAYMPDHEPALAAGLFPPDCSWMSGYRIAEGADVLIHDAQYAGDEYEEHLGWGHSSLPQAFLFAGAARVKKLVTFHHDPAHDDAALDRLLADVRSKCGVEMVPGTEGATFEV
ncbi:MAG TPA: MBL fold metallo-hydrolase, partial [Dehalococcoidia bacterium]